MADVTELIDRAITAAGGLERWERASYLEVSVDAGGALFPLKRRPLQTDTKVRVATTGQTVVLDLADDRLGILQGGDVALTADGVISERRPDARAAFRWSLRRAVRWDDLDFTYFAGAAWWTYLSSPFVWARSDVEVAAGTPHEQDDEVWETIDVTFPAGIATHCSHQRFYLDRDGHIRRHDYTAEVVSKLARAAHITDDFRHFEGLVIPTRRRVYPRGVRRRPLPWPVLVSLDIHDARLVEGGPLLADMGLGDAG